MKKTFLKGVAFASLMLAMVFGIVGCRGDVDNAKLEARVQNAIREMLNTEQLNFGDTVLNLNRDNTTVKIKGLNPDMGADSLNVSNRPVYVDVHTDYGMGLDGDNVVEIIAVILIFGTPFLISLALFSVWYKIKRDRNRVIEIAIRNNVRIDPMIFSDYKTPRTRLHSALVWMACGAGIILFFICVEAEEAIGLGGVPLFVGIAKLITYFVEDRKQRPQTEKEQNVDVE